MQLLMEVARLLVYFPQCNVGEEGVEGVDICEELGCDTVDEHTQISFEC